VADNKWTEEQLKAIELKDRRLLVSAAAGSGKTAVLVERIIRRIMDRSDPMSVDRLLVMTFTRAAASEMKERIRQRLLDALETESDPEVLLRLGEQVAIIDGASIQTIDSFCMDVVRDHTDELDIDPNIRVADESELKLIKADVLEEMLEAYYEKADEDFINFVEAYGQGTSGAGIEDKILKIYSFAQVHRDPQGWYEDQLTGGADYGMYIADTLRLVIGTYLPAMEGAAELCSREGGPKGYSQTILSDIEFIRDVCRSADYESFCRVLRSYEWPRIGRCGKNDDPQLVARVKACREDLKKKAKEWTDQFTRKDIAELKEEERNVEPYVRVLVNLAKDFDRKLTEKKREKNIIDFGDLEHMALKVLEADTGYKLRYDEIYVDEYQDTNDIQEAMINAMDRGRVFMVGDVKQSIYKFRQAKPEIFMEKYDRFVPLAGSMEGCDTVIGLNRNFRSREEVLDAVNRLFKRIMVKSLGGVEYNDDAALNKGADFPAADTKAYETELLLVNTAELEAEDSKNAAEARMIAAKIKEVLDPERGLKLWDSSRKEYRKAKLSDIVILLRSANVAGDIYLDTLLDAGIQAHCETNKGYFDSPEVRTVTAMLTAIDNPRKEIPMAAFLKSVIIGLTDDELVAYKKSPEKLTACASEKLRLAHSMLDKYRRQSRCMGIDELITRIYDETGYYDYAAALPAGKTRRANLDKLKAMASEYAATGYRGLFNFIRYIENLKTYDTDFGEASVIGEHDDAVRIMSIHKSKGLEFPVVFLANCDKKVNQMDSNEAILLDSDLGIGCVYINTEERYKQKTVKQMAVRLKLRSDTLGEELRVLYVAMTRAKEKLFITGCIKDSDKFIKSREDAVHTVNADPLELSKLRSDKGYLHWITESGVGYEYTIADIGEEVSLRNFTDSARLKTYLDGIEADKDSAKRYEAVFDFAYPGQAEVGLVSKVSISELKRRHMEALEQEEGNAAQIYLPGTGSGDIVKEYSAIIKNEEVISGAGRGTIYHEVMEKLDHLGPLPEVLPECIDRADIEAFTASELGQLFRKAQAEGRLYREHQFIMGVPANELGLEDSREPVLVQGIIDAYIEDEDGIILVDYKTDRVRSEKELADRYGIQLYYYAMALERMKRRPVKRKVIWSAELKKAIDLD